MKWAIACFKFFASLRLAVFLLVVLGIAFGTGTFIESSRGTEAAQVLVYRTPWLSFLLVLLALNLLASALDRMPWKKKHTGFLTTHLGIILILMGSLVSQALGIEGQLQIQEGKTESRMTLFDPLLQVISVASGPSSASTKRSFGERADRPGRDSDKSWTFLTDRKIFPWNGRKELVSDEPSPFKVHLLTDYPKAKLVETVLKSETGSPALHVVLKGSMAASDQWLFLENPSRNSINLGPATIRFATEPIQVSKQEKNSVGVLKFQFESGSSNEIKLDPASIGKKIPLEGTPYKIRVKRVLKDVIVEGNQLMERSKAHPSLPGADPENNPAVELSLEGDGLSEFHTIFSKFPEFPTLHGLKPSEAHVRITYETSGFSDITSKNELRFIYNSKGLPRFQIKHGTDFKEGEVQLGTEAATGWMDFKFTVDSYFEHAALNESYEPLPATSQREDAVPVVQAEFEKAGEKKTAWLPQGEINHMMVGGSDYHAMYGLKTKPLGFQIQLLDFMIDTDPGTDKPASFKSEVVLKDASQGIERKQVIQMNEPLKHRGYKIYQSAYHVAPGEPDISIFTVARDPGNPLKFAGAIIMVAGILALFYVKPFSTLKTADPKLRNR